MMQASSLPPPVQANPNTPSAQNQTQQSQLGSQLQLSGQQPQLTAANYPQLNASYNLANLANVDMSSFQGVSFFYSFLTMDSEFLRRNPNFYEEFRILIYFLLIFLFNFFSLSKVDWSSMSYANGLNGMGMYV